jgi:hypothetical protein
MRTLIAIAAASIASVTIAAFPELEKCYQQYGQLETSNSGGKKVTVYKDGAQVAGDCNEKVLARAQKEESESEILALAGVIGRNSNWASAMPVYTVAAKKNPSKICEDKDALYGLADALARPETDSIAKGGVEFMSTCWPNGKTAFTGLLVGNGDYVNTNVCRFLKSKDAIPARRASTCKKALD